MARKGQFDSSEKENAGYVPIVIAMSRQEAEQYCQLFNDHDIDAIVGDEELDQAKVKVKLPGGGRSAIGGVPVLVAEEMIEEAREVLADRDDVESFHVDQEDDLEEDDQEEEDEEFELDEDEELDEDLQEDDQEDEEEEDEEDDLLCEEDDEEELGGEEDDL